MLLPLLHISPERLAQGQRALVHDLAWASLSGAFAGGVILVAFALALGATPVQVGLLAAIPFLAQAAQLPATVLVEKLRQRKRIAVVAITAARGVVLLMAALPFVASPGVALAGLMGAQVLISLLNAVGACAVNSWLHQLIPPQQFGHFFARRLLAATVLACIGTLAAGLLVDQGARLDRLMQAYAVAFALAALAGFASSGYLARAPEPQMQPAGPAARMGERLMAPFGDRNFRRLLVFLAAWAVAANLAAPFIAVYLIEQRKYPVALVTSLWVGSQVANALTLYLWGRLSQRLSNKAVLAVVLPLHFASILALVFVDGLADPGAQLAVLVLIHLVLGVATGGIGLALGNLGLKLAPQGQGTAYLAAIGLVSAVAGGLAPIAAGALAQALQAFEVSAVLRWFGARGGGERSLLSFAHWEFVFGLSALASLYVMHALSRVDEGREVSERRVVQEFALEAWRSLNSVASVAGALGNLFPFERLTERRRWWSRGEDRSRWEEVHP